MQDASINDLNRMLRVMVRIYACAKFTIVAAAGADANHGFPGIGGPSQSRAESCNIDKHTYQV
jgi:hypothetical protein